jgi:hypothetical protein
MSLLFRVSEFVDAKVRRPDIGACGQRFLTNRKTAYIITNRATSKNVTRNTK